MFHRPQRGREAAPVLWACFCREWLQLSEALTAQWWLALVGARWSRAVELRSMIQCQEALATSVHEVFRRFAATMAPPALCRVLDELHQEHRLSRQAASLLQEAVLTKTNHVGEWQ